MLAARLSARTLIWQAAEDRHAGAQITLTDLRAAPSSAPLRLIFDLSKSSASGVRVQRACALATPHRAALPQLALASADQLLLLDTRSPRAPLQQWRLPPPLQVLEAAKK